MCASACLHLSFRCAQLIVMYRLIIRVNRHCSDSHSYEGREFLHFSRNSSRLVDIWNVLMWLHFYKESASWSAILPAGPTRLHAPIHGMSCSDYVIVLPRVDRTERLFLAITCGSLDVIVTCKKVNNYDSRQRQLRSLPAYDQLFHRPIRQRPVRRRLPRRHCRDRHRRDLFRRVPPCSDL